MLPIDKNPSTLQDLIRDATPPPANPPCDAVIVRVIDLPDTLLVWQALDDVDVEDMASDPAGVSSPLAPHAIYLEQAGDRLFAASSPLDHRVGADRRDRVARLRVLGASNRRGRGTMTRRTAPIVVAILVMSRVTIVCAQSAEPAPGSSELSRIVVVGGIAHYPGSPPPTSSARGPTTNGAGANVGLSLRYEHRMFDWLSLAGTAGVAFWIASAAADAGYTTWRLDLGLAALLKPLGRRPKLGTLNSELYLLIPFGATRPFVSAPPRRAFDEQNDGRWGWYLGSGLGWALLKNGWSAFAEIGYLRHASGARSVFTPHDPALPPVIEEIAYVDHEIFLNLGVLVAF